jgi:hypothetical protein
MEPTSPPVQWVTREERGRGATMTVRPHLVPRSRPCESYTSSPRKRPRVVCSGTALFLPNIIMVMKSRLTGWTCNSNQRYMHNIGRGRTPWQAATRKPRKMGD